MTKTLIVLATIFISSSLFAQEESTIVEMITDRPDATESSSVVPLHSIQIETGVFFESFEKNDFKTEVLGYNTTLIRFGLLEKLELRVGWNFEEHKSSFAGNENPNVLSGFSPLLLGAKVAISEEKGLLPEMALLLHTNLPFTSSTDFNVENTGVDFRFSFAHTLSEKSSLGYNLGAAWGNDSSEASYIYTLAYGYSISEKFGAYAEVYGDLPENNSANHFWDIGFTYLIQNNFQLDATLGRSFTEGQDILVSTGFSYRFPN
ncbi:MAG: transporter [Flavobacteriaceae bacterium]|nr:transporter [Flavobacteriaceae bacterium]